MSVSTSRCAQFWSQIKQMKLWVTVASDNLQLGEKLNDLT